MNIENTTSQVININKNTVIIILTIVLILSFLGINIFMILGKTLNDAMSLFSPFFKNLLALLGYTVGSTINSATEITTNVAKTGIDVAGGSIVSVGNLLKNASANNVDPNVKKSLDAKLNAGSQPTKKENFVNNDISCSSLQNPLSCNKCGWSTLTMSQNYATVQ